MMSSSNKTLSLVSLMIVAFAMVGDGADVKKILSQLQKYVHKGKIHVGITVLTSRGDNSSNSYVQSGTGTYRGGTRNSGSYERLVAEFRGLKKDLAGLKEGSLKMQKRLQVQEQTTAKSQQCLWNQLGYKQRMWPNQNSGLKKGQLRALSFIKKQKNTGLRILYSANIREHNANAHSRWYIKINGHECTKPGKIDIAHYHYRTNDIYLPTVLLGTCTATSRGAIGAGSHVISVHVRGSNSYSGWASTCFFEIREICLQNQ